MATVDQLTSQLAAACTPVPPSGPGICSVCHGCPNADWQECWSCSTTRRQVSRPAAHVVPISLTHGTGQLHFILRMYKRSPRPRDRQIHSASVVALVGRFLRDHGPCIADVAEGTWDVITTVPSTTATTDPHQLEIAFSMYEPLHEQHRTLLRRGPGQLDHNLASDTGHEVIEDVSGLRVLIVDDTFTSGARSQSAASALHLAGATVVAIVPIGRYINPDFGTHVRSYWDEQRRTPFDFGVCCLE